MNNKKSHPLTSNTLEYKKEELFFLLYITSLIIIVFIAKLYLANNDMLTHMIYVLQAIMFAVLDLRACNECYKAEWCVFDWLKESYPKDGLPSIKRSDIENLRDGIHRYGLSYSQKSKRMTLRVLNSLLLGLTFAWFIFFGRAYRNTKFYK